MENTIARDYVQSTGRGKRLSLQLRVYPEGHGQVMLRRDAKPHDAVDMPFNNAGEAAAYVRNLWDYLQGID